MNPIFVLYFYLSLLPTYMYINEGISEIVFTKY